MIDELPSLETGPVSERAVSAAVGLLEAFYYQDRREWYLLAGDEEGAREAASKATDRMATAYELEFPTVPAETARAAGAQFVRALFVQDEIENWELIRTRFPRDRPEGVILSESDRRDGTIADDTRWDLVNEHLLDVCAKTGVDERYAALQTRFWSRHGRADDRWKRDAFDAHRIKLRGMLPHCSAATVRNLARYFVVGVTVHDRWTRRDRGRDVQSLLDLVAAYYQTVFELRERPVDR